MEVLASADSNTRDLPFAEPNAGLSAFPAAVEFPSLAILKSEAFVCPVHRE